MITFFVIARLLFWVYNPREYQQYAPPHILPPTGLANEMSNTIGQHFDRRSPRVREIYDTLVAVGREFGPVEEDPKMTSIHVNRKSAFAGIQTRRDFLILTIKARAGIESPRISKSEQASANRWHHEIKIHDSNEIDAQVVGWIRDSYAISG